MSSKDQKSWRIAFEATRSEWASAYDRADQPMRLTAELVGLA